MLKVDRIAMPKGRGCGVYCASVWGVAWRGRKVPQKVQQQGFFAILVLHNCAKIVPREPRARNMPGKAKISAETDVRQNNLRHISKLRKSIFLNESVTMFRRGICHGPVGAAFPQRFPHRLATVD